MGIRSIHSAATIRNEAEYPQYAGIREWFSFDTNNQRIYVLAGDPTFLRSLVNVIFFALVVIPLQTGLGLLLALLVNQKLKGHFLPGPSISAP